MGLLNLWSTPSNKMVSFQSCKFFPGEDYFTQVELLNFFCYNLTWSLCEFGPSQTHNFSRWLTRRTRPEGDVDRPGHSWCQMENILNSKTEIHGSLMFIANSTITF